MNIKLKSDFIDYYDHWFDLDGDIFERMSAGGVNRYKMLTYLKSLKLDVPKFGLVKKLTLYNTKINKVVVYLNLNSHRGENKLLLDYKEALEKYPNKLATEYIESYNKYSESMRILQIGNKSISIIYENEDDWRSNYGCNVKTKIINIYDGIYDKIKYPLYAIDFVFDKYNNYYAIDFNIAPGIKGTGVENILKPKEVVDKIKESILYFRRNN